MYEDLRPKLSNNRDISTYTRYQKLDRTSEASHFSPTIRPFRDFKASRKDTILNKSLEGGQSIQTDTISRERKKWKPSSKRKNRFGSASGKPKRKLKTRRKSNHSVFKQMNEHRKKSGERRHQNLLDQGVYRNENYGHPNHYEGSGKTPETNYYDNFPHEFTSAQQDTHRNLNLKSDRHDIDIDRHDVITKKNKNKKGKGSKEDGEDYEYLYYYYYDYVYPDDEIAQSLGESGEWVSYGAEKRSQDLSASHGYKGYEMLPTPLAANGTSTVSSTMKDAKKKLKNENNDDNSHLKLFDSVKINDPSQNKKDNSDKTDNENSTTMKSKKFVIEK